MQFKSYAKNQTNSLLSKFASIILLVFISINNLQAQTFPTLGTCNFDTYNSGNTQKILMQLPGFPAVPSSSDFSIFFLNNASSSPSHSNEFEQGGIDVTNISGADLSNVLIPIRGIAFWTQNVPGTTFSYYTWNATTQSWTGTLGDGQTATFKVLGYSVNGVAKPVTDIQLMPATNAATGYALSEISNTYSASFTDAGTSTTYSASSSFSVPNTIPYLKLGAMPAGSSLTNVRIKMGLTFSGGEDAWINYAADGAPVGDMDYQVRSDAGIISLGYDYGDAPASYGIARHAASPCAPALYLGGTRPDYELSTTGSATVNADDNNTSSYNDEDEIIEQYQGAAKYTRSIPYVNNTAGNATLSSWIDWNNNGSFDASEMATTVVGPGSGTVTLTWRTTGAGTGEGTITGGVSLSILVRTRIGTVSAENIVATGTAVDGEVEDNLIARSLPVRLSEFTASLKQNCTAQITWVVETQENVDHFELQVSKDGSSFATFATQPLAPIGNKYSIIANVYGNNVIYYRLKTVDKNGEVSYSNTINLKPNCDNNTTISIFPTITTGKINILGLKGGENIQVFDATGRLVANQKGITNTNSVDIATVANGAYYIIIATEQYKSSFKVLKK